MNLTLLTRTLRAQLSEAGIDPNDVRPLLAHALKVAPDRLILMAGDEVSTAQQEQIQALIRRRMDREPVSKILGARLFWGRSFAVTKDVLDPRPETETLISLALEGAAPNRLLDLGTGTGCIALTLLAERPKARAVLGDISEQALAVARGNAQTLGVEDRADFIRSDWFDQIEGQFDLICSNPPYITAAEMTELSPEVAHHDPHLALSPGGDGLDPYRIIAAQAGGYLAPNGQVLVEIGWHQGSDVVGLFQENGFVSVHIHQDMDGRDRVVLAKRV